jgi:hypothetical protein
MGTNNGKVADNLSIRYQYREEESRLEKRLESEEGLDVYGKTSADNLLSIIFLFFRRVVVQREAYLL